MVTFIPSLSLLNVTAVVRVCPSCTAPDASACRKALSSSRCALTLMWRRKRVTTADTAASSMAALYLLRRIAQAACRPSLANGHDGYHFVKFHFYGGAHCETIIRSCRGADADRARFAFVKTPVRHE